MRRTLAFAALLLPFAASAVELHEGKFWRNCEADAQCVVIEGTCDKTSVNSVFKGEAERYYKQEASAAKCAPRPFWKSNNVMARCYLGGCQTITKQGSDAQPTKR
jgi:hypothetical protein